MPAPQHRRALPGRAAAAVAHPAPGAPRRPHLSLVPERQARVRVRRRRAGLALIGMAAFVCAGLFGVVVTHVALTQGQFRLDHLRSQVAAQTAAGQQLRLQVAQLSSPARIVQTAEQRLQMVTPGSVTYLSPVPPPARAGGSAPGRH